MAKHHKLMWTGMNAKTSLDPDRVWAAALAAIAATKGKFGILADTPLLKSWEIKGSETLFATSAELTFDVQISDEANGERAIRTHIIRTLLKDSSIPFGPKHMLGQKSYMIFARTLGANLTSADPGATVSYREGPMPDGYPLDVLTARVAPPT